MITLQELCLYLDQIMEPARIKDYCINGLQVEGSFTIKKIATAVSSNLQTLERAASLGVQALIVHHGLIWNGDSPEIKGIKKKKLELLFKHNLSLLAYHLPLDLHKTFGNNWKAAMDLGWTDLEPFGEAKGLVLGVKGTFPATSRELFQRSLEHYYQHSAHIALGGKETVQSAALISGGGYKFMDQAVAAGVDCFITGNFDEPAWSQAYEEGVNFYAMGHSSTERVGPLALSDYLTKHLAVNSEFIDVYNPF